jgi:hypothetical protein
VAASFRRRRIKNEDRHRRRRAEALFLVRLPPFLPPKFLGGTNILASFVTHLTDREPRSPSGQGSNQGQSREKEPNHQVSKIGTGELWR